MKRMKSIFSVLTVAAASMLLATSCNSSYPGLDYEPNPDELPKNDEDIAIDKIPIKVYTNNPGYFSLVSDTRGTGAFEEGDMPKYLDATFHVFAFRAFNPGGQSVLTEDPDLTRSAYSPNKETSNDPNNTSCLLDGKDYNLGMPFKFEKDVFTSTLGTLTKQVDDDVYWTERYQDVGYNFFGYHIDDFEPTAATTERTPDHIAYNVELDGYRDILMGYADPITEEDFAEGGIYGKDKMQNITDAERDKILATPGCYSTYAAHRNINPIIRMKHQLVLMKFKAYAGAESAKNIRITGVSVYAPTKAKMYVATRHLEDCRMEFDFSGETNNEGFNWKELQLSEPGERTTDADGNVVAIGKYPGKLKDGGYTVDWDPSWTEATPADARNPQQLGAGILLPPADSYRVKLTYEYYDGSRNEWLPHVTEYKVRPAKKDNGDASLFEAGNLYNIKIAMYGLEKIELGGTVVGWIEDGSVKPIDPDENPNNPDIIQKAQRK